MAQPTFPSPELASRASNHRKAISSPRQITTPRGKYQVCIVYEPGRTPHYVYAGALSHVLPDTLARPSTGDVDTERRWKPW